MLREESKQPGRLRRAARAPSTPSRSSTRARTHATVGAVDRFLAAVRAREDDDAETGAAGVEVRADTQDAVTPEG